MKLRLLKGMVYNACDRVRGTPFKISYLDKVDLPAAGIWIVDLKKNIAKNERGDKIELPFTQEFHNWFLKEIKKAKVGIDNIKNAELILKFDFKNNKPTTCSCNINADGKSYFYEVAFSLF